ncbi:MAG: proline--tRNA ligase [Candidatus Omnitrophica bacterium CG11_big_fil_rev_8_21_14_0_20_42_13]|uniref:Proline--tRNA ligase n=1 Tax=Candidatus Ghiorseimicrobium undicola TaxID=1974746 RepID=A0A2H0LX03_9BACT|nr:MAG: proline--tRNA ligase [Candidatus Omnitrophica bacterium CG11_big_fil_rev_8_21_14_0_20_42_13]
MRWSEAFISTLKEAPEQAESASHKLMLRSGLIRMLISGVYSYLPLGFKVLRNIENIIRDEMDNSGAQELLLPGLQPVDLWLRSGRDDLMGQTMIRFEDRRGRKICLGPTHEEVITEVVRNQVRSYKQLPFILYQIQTKYRDEIRPRFGVIRSCEFIMKDAYSFDIDKEGLDKNYKKMFEAYKNIFSRCGLSFLTTEADSGVMGGDESNEFMIPAESGEDRVVHCPNCDFTKIKGENLLHCPNCKKKLEEKTVIEVGHIFKLGTKYSESLGASFAAGNGELKPIVMGCYGIGVSRLIAAIIEQNHDQSGIIWPKEVSPYDLLISPLNVSNIEVKEAAEKLYNGLSLKFKVLLDDRDERPGAKLKDADLIGIPLRVIIGEKNLKEKKVELSRRGQDVELIDADKIIEIIKAKA